MKSDLVKENWEIEQIQEFGEQLLGHIDRLGFGHRGHHVTRTLTHLTTVEPRLVIRVASAFQEAKDKQQLMDLLVERLVSSCLRTFSGRGSSQILGLWKEANDYDVVSWRPDDPGIVRSAHSAFELVLKLHMLHPTAYDNWGKGRQEEAIFKLEAKLLKFVQERMEPKVLEPEQKTVVAQYEELRQLIPLLSMFTDPLQKQFPIHLDTDEVGQTVRKVIQELLESCSEETLMWFWTFSTKVDKEDLLAAVFLKRYGVETIINSFVTHQGFPIPH